MNSPKTIFCDIDGTLMKHSGDIVDNYKNNPITLNDVIQNIKQWEKLNYKIILTTGRKECLRDITTKQLLDAGIIFDDLIMGLPNGYRVIINDKKENSPENTAYAINVVRNKGLTCLDLSSTNVTIKDCMLFTKVEKPWGYEELIECNDKYVVKKLFMKQGNACSIQYHELKTETIVVLSGKLNIYIGESLETMTVKEYVFGDTVTIKPFTVHRMEAVEDALYIESSTNELWDVIRLKDNYNRS
jgi:mannose-6-phosphate isomerase-like protein (cupin superfamily)